MSWIRYQNVCVVNELGKVYSMRTFLYYIDKVFFHEKIDKLDAVKFSLLDSSAKKNKNMMFLCPSLRNRKTNILFIVTLVV